MRKFYNFSLAVSLALFNFTSCTMVENEIEEEEGEFAHGTFISNEGAWGASNASVSFISDEGELKNNIFKTANGRVLGDVLQSITFEGANAFLVLNTSNKVEVVTVNDFKEVGVVTDLDAPRYIAFGDKKVYVTQWGGTGSVAVVNLATLTKEKEIEVGAGPEGIVYVNNEIWVANSGGWGTDNTISVIDDVTQELSSTITLSGDDPKNFVVDAEGDVWVLCSGHVTYNPDYSIAGETPSMLIEIDPVTKLEKTLIEISQSSHPNHLKIDKSRSNIYYGGGYGFEGVYNYSTSDDMAPTTPEVSNFFYGFNVDDQNYIWGTEAPSFSDAGYVIKIDAEGNEIRYTVGVGPNGVYFLE